MVLSPYEERLLQGEEGEAIGIAMRILKKYGEVNGAEDMVEIASAHVVGCSYQIAGDAGIEIYRKLRDAGAKVSVPTTLDPGSIDFTNWEDFRTPPEYAKKQIELQQLLIEIGVIPSWSCTPYYLLNVPVFGQDIAWSESSAVSFVNSVIGARTNRMSAYVDLCAGIAGRVPRFGLHLTENRKGRYLYNIDKSLADTFEDKDFAVLGYYLGLTAEDKIPVIDGLNSAQFDQMKMMSAAGAASGSVAMYHIVGITPEARTLEEAFQGSQPEKVFEVSRSLMNEIEQSMSTFKSGEVDAVAIGCPHASLGQLRKYVDLLKGRKISDHVELWVCANSVVKGMAEEMGMIKEFEKSGGKVLVGTCHNDCPLDNWKFKNLITDSGKFAYYLPTSVNVNTHFGSSEECIMAAIKGRID